MTSKATACLLIALTLISPSACCCSMEAAAGWLIQGLFLETGIPQQASCCHAAAAYEVATPCHQASAGSHDGSRCGSGDHNEDSHHCPCREDGNGPSGPSSPLNLTAAAPQVLNSLQLPYVVPTVGGVAVMGLVAHPLSPDRPHGLCDDGQGILRAYGRLRI